jgi:protoporphyrinogen oxidase
MYYQGGFQAFADHAAATAAERGALLRYLTPVHLIRPGPDGGLILTTGGGEAAFDHVICTTGPHLLARIAPGLPPDYLAGLAGLPYMGAAVMALALEQRLMDKVYWLSLDKREFPFLACVEHTNFVDRAHYGGDHVVYLGDYVDTHHAYLSMSEGELQDAWLPALARINPRFERAWVKRAWLSRTSYAQPVVPLGFSARIPALETPIPGLYLACMSQVYPWDRGTNYAVEIGRRAARRVIAAGGD